MVKFSQQQQERLSRTQRLVSAQQEKDVAKQQQFKAKIQEAQGKLSNVQSYEEYFQKYQNLPEDMKRYFSSPEEVKQTSEYKQYQQQKQEAEASSEWETAVAVYTGRISTPQGFDPRSEVSKKAKRYVELNPSLASQSEQEFKVAKTLGSFAGEIFEKSIYSGVQKTEFVSKYEKGYTPTGTSSDLYHLSDAPQRMGGTPVYNEKGRVIGWNVLTVSQAKTKTVTQTKQTDAFGNPVATYNIDTQTYTSPEGYKTSMKISNVPKGTVKTGRFLKTGTYDVKTQTYTSPEGYKTSIPEKDIPAGTIRKVQVGGVEEKQSLDFSKEGEQIFLDFDVIERPQVTRSTFYEGSDILMIPKKTEKSKSYLEFMKDVIGYPIKKVYEEIPSGKFYLTQQSIFGIPLMSVSKISEGDLDVTLILEEFEKSLSEKQMKLLEEEISSLERQPKIEEKYQKQYQMRFEDIYSERILGGEMSFEEAEKEFSESYIAKLISFGYEEEIGEERKKLGITKVGLGIAGLETLKWLIPTTPKEYVKEIALIYGGIKAFKLLPLTVGLGIQAGTFGYGAYKTFSPTSLPEERAGGLITAVVSGAILTYSGIKYLKSPTITTKNIEMKMEKAGDLSIRSPELRRTIITDIAGKTTTVQEYKIGKVSKTFVKGRRTIVSSKIRDLFKAEPIYKGIPFADKTGYSKALKKLTKYGFTEVQARQTLRYYQPKIIEENLRGVSKLIYGEQFEKPLVKIKATRDIMQQIKVLDKELGIKTRGAKTIREYISGEGEQIAEIRGMPIYRMEFDITKTFLTKEGNIYQTLKQAGKTTKQFQQVTAVETKGIGKTVIPKGRMGDIFVGQEVPYEEVLERSIIRQTIPKGKIEISKQRSFLFEGEEPPIINIDIDELAGIKTREIISPKRSIPAGKKIEDYTSGDVKRLMKTIRSIYGKPKVENILDMKEIPINIPSATRTPQIKEILSQKNIQTVPEAKRIPKIKEAIKIKASLRLKRLSAEVLGISAGLSLKEQQLPSLKISQIIKQIERQESGLKLKELLRSDLKLTQSLSSALSLKQIFPTLNVSYTGFPAIPKIKMPRVPAIPIIFFPSAKKRKGRKGELDTFYESAYLPDFTSRIAGLEENVVSEKRAEELIKKIYTGLEIRRGVRIR